MAAYRESFVFRIETDVPATVWSGHGDLILPADDILSEPVLALGAGELVNLPDFEQLLNGTAQRLEISLSGVSEETLALALDEALQVPGAPVYIGRVRFDENWQMTEPVAWEWTGAGVNLSVSSQDGDDGRVRMLTLVVAAGDTLRKRAALSFFTDADQRRAYPTDAIFSHVAGINAGTSRKWGPK